MNGRRPVTFYSGRRIDEVIVFRRNRSSRNFAVHFPDTLTIEVVSVNAEPTLFLRQAIRHRLTCTRLHPCRSPILRGGHSLRFEDEIAIVVDRFDRQKRGNVYIRIHQEDACQALGIMPTRKYENEGGPGIRDIVTLLRDSSRKPGEDVDRFIGALALNWVVAATDGHAKNYALLHGAGGATRLAPFYDMASYLPYAEPPLHRVRLAMKVGSEYLVRRINRASWEALAKSIGVPPTQLLGRVEAVVESVAAVVDTVRQTAIEGGLDEGVISDLADRIRDRAEICLSAMR